MEARVKTYQITIDGETFDVQVGDLSSSPVQVTVNGELRQVSFRELQAEAEPAKAPAREPAEEPAEAESQVKVAPVDESAGSIVRAPMPGQILSLAVSLGDAVAEGDAVCTLEAMKMEMPVNSAAAGTVKAIHVAVGDNVANDDALVTLG